MHNLGILLFFIPFSVAASDIKEIEVPSDPDAKYAILGKKKGIAFPSQVTILTVRVGIEGQRYEMRQFECREKKFKYLGKGRTMEDLQRYPAEREWTEIFPNTPTHDLFPLACN